MYSKTHWQDRVVDPETGEVVQEGTFMSAEHFNNMEDGIEANDTAISEISESVETIETTLDTGVGTTITLTVNSSTFVMKLALKNSEGNILSESEVDLPIESMIVNAEYVEATKSLVLTLQSGSKVTVPLSALINGLVNDTRKVAGMDLKNDITVAEMVTALGVDNKVNKTSVSSGENSTTSVINVTDTKAQMAMVASIKGKTQKMVQLLGHGNMDGTGWEPYFTDNITLSFASNVATITLKKEGGGYGYGMKTTGTNYVSFIQNHIYLAKGDINPSVACPFGYDIRIVRTQVNCPANVYTTVCDRFTWDVTSQNFTVVVRPGNTIPSGSTYKVKNVQIFDLTAMFGSGKEPTIEAFNAMFTSYIPTGSYLWSAPVESVVSVGANLLDESIIKTKTWTTPSTFNAYIEVPELAHKKFFAKAVQFGSNALATYNIAFSKDTTLPATGDRIKYQTTLKTIEHDFRTADHVYMWITTGDGNISVNKNNVAENFHIMCSLANVPYIPYNKTTVLVPSEARNCVGCGLGISDSLCNTADFENGVYTQMCAEVDLGTLAWNKDATNGVVWCGSTAIPVKYKSGNVDNVCSKYTTAAVATAEGTISVANNNISSSRAIQIKDANAISASDVGKYLSGVKLVYELASVSTKPLSDYIRPLPVEQGGTLTLVNEHNLDMPSVIKFKKEVN